MKLLTSIIISLLMSGCMKESWISESVNETGLLYRIPNNFQLNKISKNLHGNVQYHEHKALGENDDYVRITVLQFPRSTEARSELPENQLKCPDLGQSSAKKILASSRDLIIAGEKENILVCSTEDRVANLVIFARNNLLISLLVSTEENNNQDLHNRFLAGLSYEQ